MTGRAGIPTGLGPALRRARQLAGWSQSKLANAVDVNHTVISRWENGERIPSLAHVYAIAGALNVAVGQLLPPLPGLEGEQADG